MTHQERHEAHLEEVRARAGLVCAAQTAASALVAGLSRNAATPIQRALYGAIGRAFTAIDFIDALTPEIRDARRDLLHASVEELQALLSQLDASATGYLGVQS